MQTPSVWSRTVSLLAGMAAFLVTNGCGPELTTPADTNVSGEWFALGPSAGLSNLTIRLSQTPDGAITGTYVGIGTEGPQFCPPNPPCVTAGPLVGSNTVLHVFFELEHAGRFSGQLIDGQTLRGSMERINLLDPIEFVRVPGIGQ